MATAPKTIVKSVKSGAAPAAAAAEAPAGGGGKSKKKLLLMIIIGVLVLAIGAVAAFMLLNKKKDGKDHKASASASAVSQLDPSKPPIFQPLEPFTVNLLSENGDQFLQATLTVQVPDLKQGEILKQYTAPIRSRILILLSGKKAVDIASTEGKTKLVEEIKKLVQEPFVPGGSGVEIVDIFITSFVIQ